MKKKSLRIILSLAICVMVMTMFSVTAFAAGDVSGAIESTWNAAKSQVQTVVNNVVFPVIDMILAILFFVKVGTSYSSTENTASLSSLRPASCLPASSSL